MIRNFYQSLSKHCRREQRDRSPMELTGLEFDKTLPSTSTPARKEEGRAGQFYEEEDGVTGTKSLPDNERI